MIEYTNENTKKTDKLLSVGEVTSYFFHEIINPLAIIKGYVEKLPKYFNEEQLNNQKHKDLISVLSKATLRIESIILGLKKYAKTDHKDNEDFCSHSHIKQIISLIEPVLIKNGIKIKTELNAQNTLIKGNIGQFEQAIMTLIINTTKIIKNDKEALIFFNTNNFENEIVIQLISNANKLDIGIADKLLAAMNGDIKVNSQNTGTIVSITIPLANKIVKETKVDNTKFTQTIEKLTGKVLIVDDEEDLRNILESFLKEFGLEVHLAENGEEALLFLKENKYNIVITDLKMPKMGGELLIQAMHDLDLLKETQIMIITGGIDASYTENQKMTLKSKIDGYLMKPFSINEVYNSVKELLYLS